MATQLNDQLGHVYTISANSKLTIDAAEDGATSSVLEAVWYNRRISYLGGDLNWRVLDINGVAGGYTLLGADPAFDPRNSATPAFFSQDVVGLAASTAYDFQVVGVNSGGRGPPSSIVSGSTTALPGPGSGPIR